jgi:hypothetical protein
MRRALTFLLVSGLSMAARAQTPAASCSGMIAGATHLGLADASGIINILDDAQAQTVFGSAECGCESSDFYLNVRLTTALGIGTAGNVQVWVGQDCDKYENRVNLNGPCELIASPTIQTFTTASDSSGDIMIPIPSVSLISPNIHDCSPHAATANSVYVLAFTDPTAPFASCTLPLAQDTREPGKPTNLTAEWLADGTLQTSWTPAADGRSYEYNLVIATADGQPLRMPPQTFESEYSMCLPDGRLLRRTLKGADQSGVVTPAPQPQPGDPLVASPAFYLAPARGDHTARWNLAQDRGYRLALVATDAFGNATSSDEVQVGANPNLPPPSKGGCTIGGVGGDGLAGLVMTLAALAWALRRRRAI